MATVVPIRPVECVKAPTAHITSGVGVVTASGDLTADELPLYRAALDTVLRRRPSYVILDLRAAGSPRSPAATAAAVRLLRRYTVRHGAQLWLASVSPVLMAALSHDRASCDDAPYRFLPSAQAAVERASAARHRPARA